MKITFWGVRGSIPTPITTEQIKEKLIYLAGEKAPKRFSDRNELEDFINDLSPIDFGSIGGNTSCVEVNVDNETLIFDMGSGMKPLGMHINKNHTKYTNQFHIFLSHTHWDHISGLPFFPQAHQSDCTLNFYSPLENLKVRLEYQQDHRFFPVGFELLKAKKNFYRLSGTSLQIKNTKISHLLLNHPGKSYAYKIESNGKSVIYMTDLYFEKADEKMINFCRNADLLIFDSQFSAQEIKEKKDYGHSAGETGVDLSIATGVCQIALFHHDPDKTDLQIQSNYNKVKDYKNQKYPTSDLSILLAYEGLELDF
jgi:phosphoribosyl 1,2-cyclic phosphodiesterase